jgi:hypothetical protein
MRKGIDKHRFDLKGIAAGKVLTPSSLVDPKYWQKATQYQFFYSIAGLVFGLCCVIGGIVLFLHGVTGTTKSWTASMLGLQSSVTDVPAGVVLFTVGMFVVFITRYVVKPQK